MAPRTLVAFLVACTSCAAQDASNPLLKAICGRTEDQLRAIVKQAAERGQPIDVAEDAGKDALAAAVYASASAEKPGGSAQPWPGCDAVATEAAKPAAASAGSAQGAKPSASAFGQMTDMLFKTQDKDKDGRLSREELQKMIDQTNAAAKAQGVSGSVDFFTAVDKNADGFADREELEAYFKAQMSGTKANAKASGAEKASKPAGGRASPEQMGTDMHELLFKRLDTNKDGSLSKEEMRTIIEKTNQNAANQAAGETGNDFFNTLDRNGDGSIDKEEAKAFFSAADGMLGGNKNKDEV